MPASSRPKAARELDIETFSSDISEMSGCRRSLLARRPHACLLERVSLLVGGITRVWARPLTHVAVVGRALWTRQRPAWPGAALGVSGGLYSPPRYDSLLLILVVGSLGGGVLRNPAR